MKLGKKPPKFDPRTLLFAKYLTEGLAPPPASVNYAKAVKTWPVYGNDRYGDCTCAASSSQFRRRVVKVIPSPLTRPASMKLQAAGKMVPQRAA